MKLFLAMLVTAVIGASAVAWFGTRVHGAHLSVDASMPVESVSPPDSAPTVKCTDNDHLLVCVYSGSLSTTCFLSIHGISCLPGDRS